MKKFDALCNTILESGGETFTFGPAMWDIDEAEKYIKKAKPKIEELDLKDVKAMQKFVKIDTKFRDSIEDERLNEPGILIDTEHGPMLIDGWHRAAARMEKGLKDMKVYYITDEKAIKKIRIR